MKQFSSILLRGLLCAATVVSGFLIPVHAEEDAGRTLVVYTCNFDDETEAIVQGFEEQYPDIEVTVEQMSASQGIERIKQEADQPAADVMWGGMSYRVYAPNSSLWQPYTSTNEANINPLYQNKDGLFTNYALYGMVFIESDDRMEELNVPARSYADLLDPAFFGEIAMGNPADSIPAYNDLINILSANGGAGQPEAWEYVQQLAENIDGVVIYSADQVAKEVGKFKYAIGFTSEKLAADAITLQEQNIVKEDEKREAEEATLVFQATEAVNETLDDFKNILKRQLNQPTTYTKVDKAVNALVKKTITVVEDVFLENHLTTRKAIRDANRYDRTLRMVYPEEGGVWLPYAAAIIKDAPHQEEAQLFMDYLLSDSAQNILYGLNIRGTNTSIVPTNPNMKAWSDLTILPADLDALWSTRKENADRWNQLLEEAAANDEEVEELD